MLCSAQMLSLNYFKIKELMVNLFFFFPQTSSKDSKNIRNLYFQSCPWTFFVLVNVASEKT